MAKIFPTGIKDPKIIVGTTESFSDGDREMNSEEIVKRVLAENRATYRSRTVIYQRGIEAWYEKVAREIVQALRQSDAEKIEKVIDEQYINSSKGIKCGDFKKGIEAVAQELGIKR